MKTLWIEDEDALNVGRVIVTKTGTKDCTVCYSCDEREDYENRLKADKVAMLDKISAEIEEVQTYDGIYIDRAFVLEIIDKYKAESEKT